MKPNNIKWTRFIAAKDEFEFELSTTKNFGDFFYKILFPLFGRSRLFSENFQFRNFDSEFR